MIRSEKVTVKDFLTYKSNPRQRNTEDRAEKAKKDHLVKWIDEHSVFFVAELPNGERYLCDAHTRQYLIQTGHFPKADLPKYLIAIVVDAKNLKEVEDKYRYFDSSKAGETASDKNYSAMKSLGHTFKSARLQKPTDLGAIPTVCCEGVKSGDQDTWMKLWKKELIKFDNYDIPKGSAKGVGKTLTAGVIAASVQLISNGYDVKDFLLKVRNDEGKKDRSQKCGVQHLVEWLTTTEEKTSGAIGYKNVAEKTLACFSLYESGKLQTRFPKLTKGFRKKYVKIKKP